MSNLKYISIPWPICRGDKILVDHITVAEINRYFCDDKTGEPIRVLPDGQLRDGCYIHPSIKMLVPKAQRSEWSQDMILDGVTLIVLKRNYHLIWAGEISPDFKQYPSYPGNHVYQDLLSFRKRYPKYVCNLPEDLLLHWYYAEGDGNKLRLNNRLRVHKLRRIDMTLNTIAKWELLHRQSIAERFNVKPTTIDSWRRLHWIDGVHYHRYGERGVIYHYEVCYHEFTHRGKREEHLRWVAENCSD